MDLWTSLKNSLKGNLVMKQSAISPSSILLRRWDILLLITIHPGWPLEHIAKVFALGIELFEGWYSYALIAPIFQHKQHLLK
jgi:hypothetical protein